MKHSKTKKNILRKINNFNLTCNDINTKLLLGLCNITKMNHDHNAELE